MKKPYALLRLTLSFLYELIASNIAVTRQVLSPRLDIRPGIIAYPVELKSPAAITCLANLITLTPGTLTLDVSEDHRTMYIHTLNVGQPAEVVADIHRAFEQYLMELER